MRRHAYLLAVLENWACRALGYDLRINLESLSFFLKNIEDGTL